MKTLAAVYTGQGLAEPLQELFLKSLPKFRLVNIIDDGIIHDVIRDRGVKKPIIRRMLKYYQVAADMGVDMILNTCSSVGDVVDIAKDIIDVPILRIDQAMARHAVENYQSIGVIATLPTTLEPTTRLIHAQADLLGKHVSVVDGLAKGAYQALIDKKAAEHDRLIMDVGRRLSQKVDCIVLAQASMMRMQKVLKQETKTVVLASPPLCIPQIKSIMES